MLHPEGESRGFPSFVFESPGAGMAKQEDARDSKSLGPSRPWGFDSPSRHHSAQTSARVFRLLRQDNIGLGEEHVVVQVVHQEERQDDDVVALVER